MKSRAVVVERDAWVVVVVLVEEEVVVGKRGRVRWKFAKGGQERGIS